MHSVYFDGNKGPEGARYGLWLRKSMQDLARIPGGPEEGMQVTIYMVGEVEAEATLEWCGEPWNAWVARPIEGTWRDYTESWDDNA